jgi:glycosyltransferase involved in cell wall biosynthesis
MKIVLCTHRFLPQFVGGVEIYTLRLAQALQQLGQTVYILVGEPVAKKDLSVEVQEDEYEHLPVIRLRYDYERRSVAYRAGYNDPLVTAQIKMVLQRLQPAVVHATSLSLLMAGTIEAASELNIPLVHTAMDRVLICRRGFHLKHDNTICSAREDAALCTACMGPHTQLETWLNRTWQITPKSLGNSLLPLAEKVVGKKADFVYAAESIQYRINYLSQWVPKIERIIAPSTYTRDMFVLNNFPADKIIVSPYGVESPERGFAKIPASVFRFGFVGRITAIKGLHVLIEAFLLLPDNNRAELIIYGDVDENSQPYKQILQNKVAHLPNVKFAGPIENANIAEAFRHMDMLVFPSISPENSPIVVLEAQAHGLPVISSDIRGVSDIIRHEVNGLIFTNHNAKDLAAQMARCLNSPELVTRLAHQSHIVKSIQSDAGDMVKVYEEVIRVRSS